MKTAVIILAVLMFLVVAAFVAGYFMFRFAIVKSKNEKRQAHYWADGGEEKGFFAEMNPERAEKAKENARRFKESVTEVAQIQSHDGLTLTGRIIENPVGRGVVIMLHGYRSCGLVDFGPSYSYFFDKGFSVLLVDERAHGDSDGKYITFGYNERFDAIDWAKFAENRFPDQPIVMYGVSMGATTVMMGAGVGYPKSVKAILADCGYTSPGAIYRKCLKQWFHLPPFPVYHAAKVWTKLFAGFDLDGVNARDSLEKLRGTGTKVLIVHGTGDGFVPYEMSVENIKAFDYMPESARREVLEFLSVEGAGHAQAFNVDTEAYLAAIDRLIEKAQI